MTKKAKIAKKRTVPKKRSTAKKADPTKRKAPAKKKRAKNAKPLTYEEAHWGWQGDPYFMDLALRLTDCFTQAPGTSLHQKGVDLVNLEVIDLISRDASFLSGEDNLGELARAIQLVCEEERRVHQPWIKPSLNEMMFQRTRRQWAIAFQIKREMDSGERENPPKIGEFQEMLEAAGCPESEQSNARKKAKFAGWTPAKSKRGPRSRQS